MPPAALMLYAAGFGTRMGALTADRPKPLIPVAGRALIDHALALVPPGLRVVVNTHYRADQIAAHVAGRGLLQSHEPDLLETGGGLRAALPLLDADPVYTLNTDAVWTGPNPLDTLAAAWDEIRMDALLLLVPPGRATGHTGRGDFAMAGDGTLSRGRASFPPWYIPARRSSRPGCWTRCRTASSPATGSGMPPRRAAGCSAFCIPAAGAMSASQARFRWPRRCWQARLATMFEPSATPRLFALPCGADFPAALVDGMIARMAGQPPEAMARATLYLNTHRMLRRVREVFGARGARLLPRLRLVTDLGRDPLAGMPPAIPPLRRRLELAQLVAGLVANQPDFAPGTGIYDLADSLATLMDEMQGEGVDPAALERLDIGDHAAHWQRALAFIRIVARYFDGSEAPDPRHGSAMWPRRWSRPGPRRHPKGR
ncbi:exonuclease-like protein [Frigidibacter mobilis]|uniref:Exonuclease-like protein n=1 Tax=Frigidibacter mobilis TaxID=1335048 RepID=A0A159Z890_9RHOB|nr:exonuclease-like protein [Frigidibacter mobilis]